jgi:tetratricopeptide (TPR) repeat protein
MQALTSAQLPLTNQVADAADTKPAASPVATQKSAPRTGTSAAQTTGAASVKAVAPAASAATAATTTPATLGTPPAAAAPGAPEPPVARMLLKPGKSLSISMETEDIVCTNDVDLARRQRESYPDSPEASFIYAVALSRTSRVEDALKEVRRARKLAEKQGGPSYFDKMIDTYEKMLTYYPDDNQVRYHLAWAYYMKAYVLAKYSHLANTSQAKYKEWVAQASKPDEPIAKPGEPITKPGEPITKPGEPITKPGEAVAIAADAEAKNVEAGTKAGSVNSKVADAAAKAGASDAKAGAADAKAGAADAKAGAADVKATASDGKAVVAVAAPNQSESTDVLGNIQKASNTISSASPQAIPQVQKYYRLATAKLDDLLKRDPSDVWARVYRAYLQAEASGDLVAAMSEWEKVREQAPTNPAAYFFLGQGYLKQGNLKECLTNVSKAVALRAIGN